MKISELRKIIRKVLREAAVLGGAASHTGAAGQGIDGPMAGPFRADANVLKAIELQVLETKVKASKLEYIKYLSIRERKWCSSFTTFFLPEKDFNARNSQPFTPIVCASRLGKSKVALWFFFFENEQILSNCCSFLFFSLALPKLVGARQWLNA